MAFKDTFKFWTHGVNVQVEYSKEATGHDNGLYIRRAGFGTIIKQRGETWNWFHFAIPSATKLDDDNVKRQHAWLRGKINNFATIKQVTVHEAKGGSDCPRIYNNNNLNLTGRELNESFDLPDRVCKGPLVMCVRVEFEDDRGEVVFCGAGAWFEEQ